jgi:EAL domain-containing protein (putative c-di-GMP-specific phosphodiesterase class I)
MADQGYDMSEPSPAPIGEERLLLEQLNRIGSTRAGYYAIHIHLSHLRSANRKPRFIKIAAYSFEALVTNFNALLYRCANGDIILICRDVPIREAEQVVHKARSLFSEDPLVSSGDIGGDDKFSTWYDLAMPRDYTSFRAIAETLKNTAERKGKVRELKPSVRNMAGVPLDPGNLSVISKKLVNARISDMIRQQFVVKIHSLNEGGLLFSEHFVSMSELQQRIAPDVNLFANPWLFQYLTEALDKRVLAILTRKNFKESDVPISLNLNVSSILTKEFQHFHKRIGHYTDKVFIEFHLTDIFSDMGAFSYVRDMLKEHGYKVVVDGLTPMTLRFFDPRLLGSDLVKISWGPEFSGDVPQDRMVEMRDVVQSTGRDKVILCRVDSEDAVKWGLSLGIHRFQGHFIDKLVSVLQAKGVM